MCIRDRGHLRPHGRDLRRHEIVGEVQPGVLDEEHVPTGVTPVGHDDAGEGPFGGYEFRRDDERTILQVRGDRFGERPDLTVKLVARPAISGVSEHARLIVERKNLVLLRLCPPCLLYTSRCV